MTTPTIPRTSPAPAFLAQLEAPWVRHGLALALALAVPSLLRLLTQASSPGTGVFAFLTLVAGFGLMLVGVLLYLWWTYTQWAHRDAEEWNRHWRLGRGASAFTRHPAWFAVILFVVGQALVGTTLWLVLWAVLAMAALQWLAIRYEEPRLAHAHGAEYEAYQARVSRWLPWRSLLRLLRDMAPSARR